MFKLGLGVAPGKLNVNIGNIQLLGQVQLQSSGSGHDDVRGTIVTEELGETESSGSGTEHENGRTEFGGNLFETVSSARGRLKQGSIDVGEVVYLEDLASRVGTVLRKPTIHFGEVSFSAKMSYIDGPLTGYAMSLELLAQQELSAATVETLITEFRVICADTLANLKTLYVLSDRSNNTNSLMSFKVEIVSD